MPHVLNEFIPRLPLPCPRGAVAFPGLCFNDLDKHGLHVFAEPSPGMLQFGVVQEQACEEYGQLPAVAVPPVAGPNGMAGLDDAEQVETEGGYQGIAGFKMNRRRRPQAGVIAISTDAAVEAASVVEWGKGCGEITTNCWRSYTPAGRREPSFRKSAAHFTTSCCHLFG